MYRIGAMGGDGVGPELIENGVRVLAEVAKIEDFGYELVRYPHSSSHFKATGELLSEQTLQEIAGLDALFFGAAGDPSLPPATMEVGLLMRIINKLDLTVNVRPATLYAEHLTPLKGRKAGDIDMVLVRESNEDFHPIPGGVLREGTADEVAVGGLIYTRKAVERTTRYALDLARKRRRQLVLVTHSIGIPAQRIWGRTLDEVARDYPEVEVRKVAADVGHMMLVTEPEKLDVVLTTFLFGGNMSDIMGAIVGGIGLIASARVNPEIRFGLFEPAHGSAPKYTDLDKVSPMATLRALAMLLDHIGEPAAARRIERAIADVMSSGRVPDATTRCLVGTTEATNAVIAALSQV